ncbi:MAG: GNAT family N-acetyltransferase [Maribacter sp.]|nr:GNAT family N-acetyltransferase [Maribacter sp.]
MNTISIRRATLADLPVLQKFEQGVIDWERPFDKTIAEDPVWYYDLEGLILDEQKAVLVALHENIIVGCGIGMEKEARHYLDHTTYAYLGLMYTHPDYRGLGINGRIIAALKEWATSKGLHEIRLTVYNDNLSAIRAYEKIGFKRHIIEMRLT